jgi:hypothetical protein
MDESGEDLARLALKAALARLESGEARATGDANSFVVVVIAVPGNSGSAAVETPESHQQADISPADHPGLEKFSIQKVPAPSPGMRPCFVEPDRVCVGSGACEMRGF